MREEKPDQQKFAGLYRTTLAPLRRYLARMLGSTTEAQDVAHDAYLRVYPKVQDESARNPEAVLYTTARRLALNKIKRRAIAPFAAGEPRLETAASPNPGVVQQVIARQELQQLEAALRQLPPGCRTVLLLRKIELLSHAEIAERLGISISTVEKQHARALRLLRLALPARINVTQSNPPPTQEVRS
jgi:RNA polymerase sigma-70 factor (ECF subfamily)